MSFVENNRYNDSNIFCTNTDQKKGLNPLKNRNESQIMILVV